MIRVWILHGGQMHWLICAVSDDLLYVDAVLGQDWHSLYQDDPDSCSPSTPDSSEGSIEEGCFIK